MESKNGFPTFKEKQDISKDVPMEELSPKADTKEKSTFMHHSFFRNTFSRTQSTIKDGKLGLQDQQRSVFISRLVTIIAIIVIVGIFLVPIILYYALKTSPIPELNSVLGDVNISMVNKYYYLI